MDYTGCPTQSRGEMLAEWGFLPGMYFMAGGSVWQIHPRVNDDRGGRCIDCDHPIGGPDDATGVTVDNEGDYGVVRDRCHCPGGDGKARITVRRGKRPGVYQGEIIHVWYDAAGYAARRREGPIMARK